MDLASLLRLGAGALSAHQSRMETIHNNVANAATPGYRRQRVNLVTLGGNLSAASLKGVTVGSHQSIDAPFIDRQLVYQRGDFGFYSARAELAAALEAVSNPLDGNDLGASVRDVFAAARDLSADPANPTLRSQLVAKADDMADHFQRIHSQFSEAREAAYERIVSQVDEINGQLSRIAELDQAIRQSVAAGEHPGDLVDTRDELVNQVASAIGIRALPREDGTVQLVTHEGRALVESGRARTLEVQVGDPHPLSLTVRDGNGAPESINTVGGALGGQISAHDDVIGAQIAGLDQLAFDFAQAFNAIHQGGAGLDGVSGRDFFEPLAGPDGAAGQLAVAAGIQADPDTIAAAGGAGEVPGGNTTLLALIALEDTDLAGGRTIGRGLAELSSSLGQGLRSDLNHAEVSSSGIAQLESMQAAISGVSLEEELIAMTEAQRAFEAAGKLIQTTDILFDTVLSLKR